MKSNRPGLQPSQPVHDLQDSFNRQNPCSPLGIDGKEAAVGPDKRNGDLVPGLVLHENFGRHASAEATNGARAMDLAHGGPHDSEIALGVDQLAGQEHFADDHRLRPLSGGQLRTEHLKRTLVVQLDHRRSAGVSGVVVVQECIRRRS